MQDQHQQFERAVWPHLRSAFSLARWLVGNRHDAEDVVQEAFIKAFKVVDRMREHDTRSYVLAIVRNTALNHLQRKQPKAEVTFSPEMPEAADPAAGPERSVLEKERTQRLRSAIERLPPEFRETIVLREVEGLAYKEIAWILKVPIGTVMSRLSRARCMLMMDLVSEAGEQS